METVFLKILNMSITAGWLVLAVLLMRLLLRKAPRFLTVIMWALVGIRLVLPFSFESVLSLIPSAETVPPEILMDRSPELHTGIDALNSAVNPIISQSFAPEPAASANPLQILTAFAGWIWIIGMVCMALYTLISYLRIWHRVREAVPMQGKVYLCDRIDTPFILGILRPRIYLPPAMNDQDIPYVLAHEQAHLQRRDHLWKPLGFLLLTIHWFNPLLWVAYILLCRDIETACDEKVLKTMGEEIKKPYSLALINCSIPRKMVAACPLAFGEVSVKSRIKKVLNYKKPAFWLLIAAVVVCIVLSVCFLTNPSTVNEQMQIFLDCQIAAHHQSEKSTGRACCLDYEILGTGKKGKTTTVYLWVLYEEYSYQNGELYQETGTHIPTVITARKEDGNYRLVEYFEPRDGAYNPGDIKAKFPIYLWPKAMDSQRYIDRQQRACRELAEQYFKENPPTEQPPLSLDNLDSAYVILDYTHDLIDAVDYDIDGDGVKELCEMYYGPTSGLFTYGLVALENGEPEYCNIFLSDWGELSFVQKDDGTIGVCRDGTKQNSGKEIYDILIVNGQIQLVCAGIPLDYWGPQGIGQSAQIQFQPADFDDWGLRMDLICGDANYLAAVFDYHGPAAQIKGELTANNVYTLYVIHNGSQITYADYVRHVLGLDYAPPKVQFALQTYPIGDDNTVKIAVPLSDLYGQLPAASYAVSKEVTLHTEGGQTLTREYTAQFAIVDEPSPGGTSVQEAFDVTVSYAGGVDAGALYNDALNTDKMAISAVRHLPIYKFDTRDELEQFHANYIGTPVSNTGWDEAPCFTATLSKYDDAFFEGNGLLLVYVACSNCTHRFGVQSIYRDSQTLCVHIEETTGATEVADAEADWFIAIAIPDSMVKTCKQFDADL